MNLLRVALVFVSCYSFIILVQASPRTDYFDPHNFDESARQNLFSDYYSNFRRRLYQSDPQSAYISPDDSIVRVPSFTVERLGVPDLDTNIVKQDPFYSVGPIVYPGYDTNVNRASSHVSQHKDIMGLFKNYKAH